MSLNNFLWKLFMSRVARKHGFVDPMVLFSRLVRFSQPSEVAAPTELLRATAVLHARGLVNSQAIQHNLDWVWPYWVNRQFDPRDDAFVPRAFSLTHINLTHRTWTALGLPDSPETPLVDPRGLVTPFWDGWSIDGWIMRKSDVVVPSHKKTVEQKLDIHEQGYAVITKIKDENTELCINSRLLKSEQQKEMCYTCYQLKGQGSLVISVRPYNPEGISFIESIDVLEGQAALLINNEHKIFFDRQWSKCLLSNYKNGDVVHRLDEDGGLKHVKCPVGLATAAVVFLNPTQEELEVNVTVPLKSDKQKKSCIVRDSSNKSSWTKALEKTPILKIPDQKFQHLYDVAVRTLFIHTAEDVFAGPFVYKRFWFRDAAFILNALLSLGMFDRVENRIQQFPARQKISGYFLSQEGEWDSNGEVLWLLERYSRLSHRRLEDEVYESALKGAQWIIKKRLRDNLNKPHSGLMPAGFSAEHFGPNDYYYWDNFWSMAGLSSASYLAEKAGDNKSADRFLSQSQQLKSCVEKSLQIVANRLERLAIPASPYRRLDSAAVGSLAAGYPLQLDSQKNTRLIDTVNYLMDHCLVEGGFFHDMSHSGINPYLTLHMAQVLLMLNDPRYLDLMTAIARFSTDTGVWAEAMHPRTKGGCMGDCQHVWAAAEWVMMIHHCFIREEGEKLVLCSGIPEEWIKDEKMISLGPVRTRHGKLALDIILSQDTIEICYTARWHTQKPEMEVRFTDDRLKNKKINLVEV
ncbi:MAG: hypothetical protein KC618_01350 [Candidatus Omnitrophica bacterium]|nr:hypothetical protein [Candidatus Omnitrophota bacterium]